LTLLITVGYGFAFAGQDESGEWCASDFGLNDGVSDVTPMEIIRQNGKGKSTFINVSSRLTKRHRQFVVDVD